MFDALLERPSIHVAIAICVEALAMHFVFRPTPYSTQVGMKYSQQSNHGGIGRLVRVGLCER